MKHALLASVLLFPLFLLGETPVVDTPAPAPSLSDALTLYQRGNFEAAADEYRRLVSANPKNSDAFAGLIRTLLKQKKVVEARATLDKALQTADSSAVRVVTGEVEFREGLVSEAEREWANVINSGHPDGRAYLGLARISEALLLYKRAQTMLEKAHALDPEDSDIRKAWIRKLSRAERIKYLEEYLAHDTADDAETRIHMEQSLEYLKALAVVPGRGCHLVGKFTPTETPMVALLRDPTHLVGYGLDVSIAGQKSQLLLDTGAGGIVVSRRIAEKAGLKQLSASTYGGIGDKGQVQGYVALAPSIKVGGLEFQDCPVNVIDRRSVVNEDGLIGADVFQSFLVNLDFAQHTLRLSELPKRPGSTGENLSLWAESGNEGEKPGTDESGEEGLSSASAKSPERGPFDRYIAPEMQNYSQVLRFGHDLLIPTFVNDDKLAQFFLIDSGGFTTQLSLNAAKSVTKVHKNPRMRVAGISGEVKDVYVADEATLTFARLRQPTKDVLVLDLKRTSDNHGIEVSGIIGFTTLRLLDIKIDYRDGLVLMDYNRPK